MNKIVINICIVLMLLILPSRTFAFKMNNEDYVRVLFNSEILNVNIETDSNFILYEFDINTESLIELKALDTNRVEISIIDNNYIVSYNSTQEIYDLSDKQIFLGTSGGTFKFNNNSYRDYISVIAKDGKQRVINYVTMQHYLYGVVPYEMPSSWNIEALKAQTIAARTYVKKNMMGSTNKLFDVTDSVSSQVYKGINGEKQNSNRAVDETAGIYMKYENVYINAVYHSNSGGYTENSENIWNYKVPYLVGKKDDYSLNTKETNWEYAISYDKLSEVLNSKFPNLGSVKNIKILEKTKNNRNIKIKIIGETAEQILEKEEIRKYLGYTNLKSIWYDIDFGNSSLSFYDNVEKKVIRASMENIYAMDKNGKKIQVENPLNIQGKDSKEVYKNESNQVVFSGHGYGHGIGMSQYGAKNMADLGMKYEDILKFYYDGIILVKE